MPTVRRDDGAEIAYSVDGPDDGPAVLLVMGLAYPDAMWFRLVPGLAQTRRVVRVDNRGAGLTGDVPGPYTVPTMAGDCLAVLDELGIDVVDLVGISMGGLIAQQIVHTVPQRVRSLCLVATHAGAGHVVLDDDALAMLMARGQMTPEEAAEVAVPFNYAPATPRERIEQDWAVRLPLAASPTGYLGQVSGAMSWAGFDRLPGIAVRTLVLHGELDRLVPPANGRMLAEHIPGAELVLVPDANHLLMTDQPEQVEKVLLDWLDRS